MKDTLTNIVKNQNSKDALGHALENGVIDDLVDGNSTKADVMNELMMSFVNIPSNTQNTDKEVDATIKAANEISDLVDASNSQTKEFEFEGETEKEKQNDAVLMMENLAGSKTVMELVNDDESATSKVVDDLVMDTDTVSYGIENANISAADKITLRKFFNIA